MILDVSPAAYEEKSILRNLLQLYLYDFSEIDGKGVNDSGIFDSQYLELYWSEPERFPYLVRIDAQLAGFALLRKGTYFSEQEEQDLIGMVMAEFFVMRKFRRQGVGSRVARQLFDRFPGRWEISQKLENKIGQAFWRTLIADYTNGSYREVLLDKFGPVQVFDNSNLPVK